MTPPRPALAAAPTAVASPPCRPRASVLEPRGPIFVSGRQHSGNTMLTWILSRVPGCFAATDESDFFERRRLCDGIRDAERRAESVVALLRLEDDELREKVLERLRSDRPRCALELYREGMDFVSSAQGASVWVQKATSYVFYAPEILRDLPDARIVYLLRNPYDLAASKKRRDPGEERLFGLLAGWNRGLALAERLSREYPRRFRIVLYEDLVREPRRELSDLFEFLGLAFDRDCLEIPHVNRSEAKYAETSERRGVFTSRVGYYEGVLGPAEITAIDWLVSRRGLERHYPGLAARRGSRGARLRALGLLAGGPLRFAGEQVRRLLREPVPTVLRTLRRLR